ncbi:hypothetical protein ALCH109712_13130 [Alkalicoccus chagannorensis]
MDLGSVLYADRSSGAHGYRQESRPYSCFISVKESYRALILSRRFLPGHSKKPYVRVVLKTTGIRRILLVPLSVSEGCRRLPMRWYAFQSHDENLVDSTGRARRAAIQTSTPRDKSTTPRRKSPPKDSLPATRGERYVEVCTPRKRQRIRTESRHWRACRSRRTLSAGLVFNYFFPSPGEEGIFRRR